ncbi:hypothetical protein NDU88_003815 [Pleurodeles waltl]|uniref:Uncharacterized protein n=1 Tax=Pleurodeles waltl TaxID=8319 RepID=A0AAV7W377_PLEWA|nr:hypothetical protein NDU88_003815 [Pleurodeles waltl]
MTSPAHRGPRDSRFQSHSHRPPQSFPPSGNTSPAPTQRAHTSVPRTRQAAVCPPLEGTQANPPPQQQQGPGGSGSGHTVQGTEALGNWGTGRAEVVDVILHWFWRGLCSQSASSCQGQGEDRSREPTLHEALSNIMGAYHQSQETMATVLAKFQETQHLEEEQYFGFREELRSSIPPPGTIGGVLKEVLNTRRDTVVQQGAPDTSLDDELPTTSTGASVQEARHRTTTPAPHPLQRKNHPANGP